MGLSYFRSVGDCVGDYVGSVGLLRFVLFAALWVTQSHLGME